MISKRYRGQRRSPEVQLRRVPDFSGTLNAKLFDYYFCISLKSEAAHCAGSFVGYCSISF